MLEVKDLSVDYFGEGRTVKAVRNISLAAARGEALGVVGESGSGKSTVALAIMRLIASPGKIVSGEILFHGLDLLQFSAEEMVKVRGAKISMIFQDPFTSLNPVYTVGEQIAEAVRLHQGLGRKAAWQRAVEMLELAQIQLPALRAKDYPHQFSGGMKQRVMIAMALACEPELLLADEPTTALDVTVQAEILRLLKELRDKFNLGIIFITHNFGIVKRFCDRVIVMREGGVVEEGRTKEVLSAPKSAYTKRLIACLKELNP